MDIRNDLYAYRPTRKEEVLKRRVSNPLFRKMFGRKTTDENLQE